MGFLSRGRGVFGKSGRASGEAGAGRRLGEMWEDGPEAFGLVQDVAMDSEAGPLTQDQGAFCVDSCVDWAGFWVDLGRQIPAWLAGKNSRSCALPRFYTVSCRN